MSNVFFPMTDTQLALCVPKLPSAVRRLYLPFINAAMKEFGIVGIVERAAFIAQMEHESQGLTRWRENLNYSAKRLTQVWPNRFPTLAAAAPYAHNPAALAERAYGGRMGNIPASKSGLSVPEADAFRYCGRSPFQLTGRDQYEDAGFALGLDLLMHPELAEQPEHGFRIAAWYWKARGCQKLARSLRGRHDATEAATLLALTKRINGGTNGHDDRVTQYWGNFAVLNRAQSAVLAEKVLKQGVAANPSIPTPETHTPREIAAEVTDPSAHTAAAEVREQEKARSVIEMAERLPASAIKDAYKSVPARATNVFVRLITALSIALAAGNVWAWLGVIVFALAVAGAVYHHRADLRRWKTLFFMKLGELILGKQELPAQ